jgi:predicted transcriptional regulator
MVIEINAEQEAQLLKIAEQWGRTAEEVASGVLDRGLQARLRFLAGVDEGLRDAEAGRLLEPEEVWAGIEQTLRH